MDNKDKLKITKETYRISFSECDPSSPCEKSRSYFLKREEPKNEEEKQLMLTFLDYATEAFLQDFLITSGAVKEKVMTRIEKVTLIKEKNEGE